MMNYEVSKVLLDAGFKKRKLEEFSVPEIFSDLEFAPELLPFCDKARLSGVLIFTDSQNTKVAQYELKKLRAGINGRLKPIICDFCYTYRPGAKIALITFNLNHEKTKSVAHYICADIACSLHVRGLTDVLVLAKSQMREDLTIEERIERLKKKTAAIFEHNGSVKLEGHAD